MNDLSAESQSSQQLCSSQTIFPEGLHRFLIILVETPGRAGNGQRVFKWPLIYVHLFCCLCQFCNQIRSLDLINIINHKKLRTVFQMRVKISDVCQNMYQNEMEKQLATLHQNYESHLLCILLSIQQTLLNRNMVGSSGYKKPDEGEDV